MFTWFLLIVDCHSFANTPFKSDLVQDGERPDFCIGTDEYHTPKWLVDMVYQFLTKQGYIVKLNYPYVGTIVPLKHYKKSNNVYSVMIDVNRKLYMDGGNVDYDQVTKLNQLFSDLFLNT